ncbi:MAG: phage protein NinX family protein [Rheinheimera sp.]|nr:phage protein NinX family protein [Rheinheimera sp.]
MMKDLVKIKTSELTGAALDYAVAVATGWCIRSKPGNGADKTGFYAAGPSYNYFWKEAQQDRPVESYYWWCPSESWKDCGTFIGTLVHWLEEQGSGCWYARCGGEYGNGSTPQIAICRAVVACKLGDEVEVPAELSGGC